MTFHDDPLWQAAYVALLDITEATDGMEGNDIVDQVRKHAMMTLTEIAQGVTNRDRKMRDIKLHNVANITVALRTLLSVLWGQEVFSDEQFEKLDASYEALGNKLPR